jgi:hypothetical protein
LRASGRAWLGTCRPGIEAAVMPQGCAAAADDDHGLLADPPAPRDVDGQAHTCPQLTLEGPHPGERRGMRPAPGGTARARAADAHACAAGGTDREQRDPGPLGGRAAADPDYGERVEQQRRRGHGRLEAREQIGGRCGYRRRDGSRRGRGVGRCLRRGLGGGRRARRRSRRRRSRVRCRRGSRAWCRRRLDRTSGIRHGAGRVR